MRNILFLFLVCTLFLGCYASKESSLYDNYLCGHSKINSGSYYTYKDIKKRYPLIDTTIFKGVSLVYSRGCDGSDQSSGKLYILNLDQGNLLRIFGEGEMILIKKDVFMEVDKQEFEANLSKLRGVYSWIACDGFNATDACHDNFRILEDREEVARMTSTMCYNFEHVDKCPPLDERQALKYMYKIAFGPKYKEYKKYDRR